MGAQYPKTHPFLYFVFLSRAPFSALAGLAEHAYTGAGRGLVQHIVTDAAHQETGGGGASLREGPAVRLERNAVGASFLRLRGQGYCITPPSAVE